jgi:hypothetical protein
MQLLQLLTCQLVRVHALTIWYCFMFTDETIVPLPPRGDGPVARDTISAVFDLLADLVSARVGYRVGNVSALQRAIALMARSLSATMREPSLVEPSGDDPELTVPIVAVRFSLSQERVRQYCREQQLGRFCERERRYLIRESEVEALLARRPVAAATRLAAVAQFDRLVVDHATQVR